MSVCARWIWPLSWRVWRSTWQGPMAVDLAVPEVKRSFVQRLFTRIAPRYDWFNRLASFGLDQRWRRDVVKRGGIGLGQRVLDVCAGTGDLAMLCASEVR